MGQCKLIYLPLGVGASVAVGRKVSLLRIDGVGLHYTTATPF